MANNYSNDIGSDFATLSDGSGYDNTYDSKVLNPYFDNNYSGEQNLYSSIAAETIQSKGVEAIYIPRVFIDKDPIFGEDPRSQFTTYYAISIYIESAEGWGGQQDYISQFGYMIDDQMDFTISPSLFYRQTGGLKPENGDVLYFPLAQSLMELNWVETEKPFYALGSNNIVRKCSAKKWVYNGETVNMSTSQENSEVIQSYVDDLTDLETNLSAINGVSDHTQWLDRDTTEQEQAETEADNFVSEEQDIPDIASLLDESD